MASQGKGAYPVPYYNPIIPDERFKLSGDSNFVHFTRGRYVARNAAEEEAARAALRAHGEDKPDLWRGDDRRKEWVCRHCGFATFNEEAKDAHEASGRH